MANPQIAQGTLNRLRCHVTIPGYTNLNNSPAYMGKSFAKVTFDGDFDKLIETATGAVTSPEPYVLATVEVGVLRTQALSAAWMAQAQNISDLGNVSIFPDSIVYPEIDLSNCVLRHLDPGAFDGTDPVVRLTLAGVLYVNNGLWTM